MRQHFPQPLAGTPISTGRSTRYGFRTMQVIFASRKLSSSPQIREYWAQINIMAPSKQEQEVCLAAAVSNKRPELLSEIERSCGFNEDEGYVIANLLKPNLGYKRLTMPEWRTTANAREESLTSGSE